MEWRLRRVLPAATVTAHAKPHAQQQLASDLEVERAVMGQRGRPSSFGEVQRGNPQPRRWLHFLSTAALLHFSRRTWGYCSGSSPTDQLVRKFKDGLGISMTMKKIFFSYPYSSTSLKWGLRRVVPAATVTTHAKPHAQQQLPHDLELKRAAMGQRCRPQRFGEVQRGNPQLRRWLDFCCT